jgi:cytochrome c oxidase assembly protein subunit 11
MTASPRPPPQRRHRAIAAWCVVLVVTMVGAAYASVPLYRMFCAVTGFDGTPMRATGPSQRTLEQTITVRFDGNVAPSLPWRFGPVETTMTVKLGENAVATYKATNLSGKRIVATAAYNIFPEVAASYFNKIECFCFTEQVLEPGQTAELALSFFIDPAIVADKDARRVSVVTVSYTFYPTATPGVAEKKTSKSG